MVTQDRRRSQMDVYRDLIDLLRYCYHDQAEQEDSPEGAYLYGAMSGLHMGLILMQHAPPHYVEDLLAVIEGMASETTWLEGQGRPRSSHETAKSLHKAVPIYETQEA